VGFNEPPHFDDDHNKMLSQTVGMRDFNWSFSSKSGSASTATIHQRLHFEERQDRCNLSTPFSVKAHRWVDFDGVQGWRHHITKTSIAKPLPISTELLAFPNLQ
jgi:hypothetical protein